MTERIASTFDRWTSRIIVVCAVGTCVCFAGLAYVQSQISGQAAEGQRARDRQTAVFPVSVKVYEAAHARGEISAAELRCFETGRQCPRRKP